SVDLYYLYVYLTVTSCRFIFLFFIYFFFFFNAPATTEIYTLSLHDALPILGARTSATIGAALEVGFEPASFFRGPSETEGFGSRDRKSTRLNSSHGSISYAVFCLKKKKKKMTKNIVELKVRNMIYED